MPAHIQLRESKPKAHACAIFCGPEGFLSVEELVQRTERGINLYAERQPLKYRSAMLPRHPDGRRLHGWELRVESKT